MVAPSPELQRKIDNSKKLRKEGKDLDIHSRIFPEHYITPDALDIFNQIRPWEFKTVVKQKKYKNKNRTLQQEEIFYVPTIPNPKVLVLCVEFSDEPSTLPLSSINERFNPTSETLNINKYFNDISLGKHNPSFEVHGWYTMPKTKAYYANEKSGIDYNGITELTTDVIKEATKDTSINFCIFDNDKDNTIDYIAIIASGKSAETTGDLNDLWSVAYGKEITTGKYCEGYNITTNMFMRSSEYSLNYNCTGVYCHEYAHIIGADDMYDYSGTTIGAGYWSLMSNGNYLNAGNTPCNIDAYNREKIGWATIGLNLTGYNSIKNSLISDVIYKYTTPSPDEWFLIENRHQTGWDSYIPGNGILIWHVTKRCKLYPLSSYNAYLVQADGKNDLGSNKINNGDSGDPYPGSTNNTLFSQISNPNNLLCGSTTIYLNYDIINISDSSENMIFYTTTCTPTSDFTIEE